MILGSFVMCAVELPNGTVSHPVKHPWHLLPTVFTHSEAHELARDWRNNKGPARPNCVVTVTKLKTSFARAEMTEVIRAEHRSRDSGYDKGDPS